jgi:hypothetical protein
MRKGSTPLLSINPSNAPFSAHCGLPRIASRISRSAGAKSRLQTARVLPNRNNIA